MPEVIAAISLALVSLVVIAAAVYVLGFMLTVPVSMVVSIVRSAREHPLRGHKHGHRAALHH
jgi:hypothetical protein